MTVVGGGVAGVAAAHFLSDPCHGGRYKVTLLQRGWRLGGKGASGRNAQEHDRIEEHGLHLWFGFYHEAFALMRAAHAQLTRDCPDAYRQDFAPVECLGLWQGTGKNRTEGLRLPLPDSGLPSPDEARPDLHQTARILRQWFSAVFHAQAREYLGAADDPIGPMPRVPKALEDPQEKGFLGVSQAHELRGGAEVLRWIAGMLYERADAARAAGAGSTRDPAKILPLAQLCDFFAGAFCGALAEPNPILCGEPLDWDPANLADIDGKDFREWLSPHLVQPGSALAAPFLRALYDLVFAYPRGDRSPPKVGGEPGQIAAGVALRGLFDIAFHHHGTVMFKMLGGMGDVIFAPLYQSLVARGVDIRFFSEVTGFEVRDGRVEAIDCVPQLELAGHAYQPFRCVRDRAAWPNEPLWDQIAEADAERLRGHDLEREDNPLGRPAQRLECGSDFDAVVLAVPVEEVARIGGGLAGECGRLATALAAGNTVATQAMQLWLADSPPTESEHTVSGGYAPPWDTYADMSHVLTSECWPQGGEPAAVAYLCGALDERLTGADQAAADAAVAKLARAEENVRVHRESAGPPRVLGRYSRANVAPSSRYTLSLPGTIADRIAPGGSGLANLALAGDWTATEVNAGCVEAAAESGRLAAEAIERFAGEETG